MKLIFESVYRHHQLLNSDRDLSSNHTASQPFVQDFVMYTLTSMNNKN